MSTEDGATAAACGSTRITQISSGHSDSHGRADTAIRMEDGRDLHVRYSTIAARSQRAT